MKVIAVEFEEVAARNVCGSGGESPASVADGLSTVAVHRLLAIQAFSFLKSLISCDFSLLSAQLLAYRILTN
jgi:hypothetical protein